MTEFLRYSAAAAKRQPRPYQSKCVEKALKSLDGQKPTLLHIATGGGKTFVANNVVEKHLGRGGYALWITKDWWLLRQAATDIAQRKRGKATRLRRLGGNNGELRHIPPYGKNDRLAVLYTTLQTFHQRLKSGDIPSAHLKLIVWDECHWGYTASSGKVLMDWARDRSIPVLGLTATPRVLDDFELACSHDFRQLVRDGFLADYKPFTFRTGVTWDPRRHNNSDFTGKSLRVLSKNSKRNRQIVYEYVDKASFYGKTIFFACNIEHAELLAKELQKNGVTARVIHSDLQPAECERIIEKFSNSEVNVLVNVVKLTHGISIPSIESVFLCRPTTSDILFSQMVGRGAHASEKDTFNLVEFTDNLTHFEHVLHAKEFFGSPTTSNAYSHRNRRWRHKFDRGFEPTWTRDDVPEEVRGLWYRDGQTFGVEFELTNENYECPDAIPDDEYMRVATALLNHLREQLGDSKVCARPYKGYHQDETYREWKVERDRSVGWEVVSPILKGKAGLIELHNACAALSAAVNDKDLGIDVNHWRCGTHVHIGWDDEHVAKALQLTHFLEPILRSLVPPSRFAEFVPEQRSYNTDTPNMYCRPVSDVYDVEELDDEASVIDVKSMASEDPRDGGRTIGLNVTPLFEGLDHIEARLLGGTTEAGKLLPWLSLWMRILWRAEQPEQPWLGYDRDPNSVFSGLDLRDVLSKDIIGVPDDNTSFRKRLEKRQKDIFRIWKRHEELREWLPRCHDHWELDVELTLAKKSPVVTHKFEELDSDSQKLAVWCTLVGEGSQHRDKAIRLSAKRLREQEWVDDFRRLQERSPLYKLIEDALQNARMDGADGRFDIPHYCEVRAFRLFDDMRDEDWRRCVVEALKSNEGEAFSSEIFPLVFSESQRRYGIGRQNLTKNVRRRIKSAINSCIRRRYIRRRQGNRLVLNQ